MVAYVQDHGLQSIAMADFSNPPANPNPLAIAKVKKVEFEKSLADINRLIELLENNPEIDELLKLSRRFVG